MNNNVNMIKYTKVYRYTDHHPPSITCIPRNELQRTDTGSTVSPAKVRDGALSGGGKKAGRSEVLTFLAQDSSETQKINSTFVVCSLLPNTEIKLFNYKGTWISKLCICTNNL